MSTHTDIERAEAEAIRRASLTGTTFYVLGPCPVDGYWVTDESFRVALWHDREPLFVVRP